MQKQSKNSSVVHASGYFSIQSCKCGSVVVEMGNMSYRLTEEGFFEFARTVGAAFEKVTGQNVELLSADMATQSPINWNEASSNNGTKEILN